MDFFEKISQYNLVNYLVPGAMFCVLSSRLYGIDIAGEDPLTSVFIYYFVGMVLSRIGSLTVEPLMKRLGFIRFSDYGDYIVAERSDPKISILLETANFYRSILGGIVSFIALGVAVLIISKGYLSGGHVVGIVTVVVLLLTALGYRKQVDYVRKRVEKRISDNADS